jgi:hypothetical protein
LSVVDSFWPEDSRSLLIFHCRSSPFSALFSHVRYLLLPLLSPISLHCCLRAERAAPADRFFFLHEVVAQLILSGCLFSLGSPKVSIFMWIVAGTRSGHILERPD